MLIPPVAVEARCEVFLAPLVPEARDFALRLQRELRKAAVSVMMDHEGRGLKSQMKRADKLGARFVAILGQDEMAKVRWTIRNMKASTQEEIGLDAAAAYLIKETTVG